MMKNIETLYEGVGIRIYERHEIHKRGEEKPQFRTSKNLRFKRCHWKGSAWTSAAKWLKIFMFLILDFFTKEFKV